jgi:hypothetical protein
VVVVVVFLWVLPVVEVPDFAEGGDALDDFVVGGFGVDGLAAVDAGGAVVGEVSPLV